MTLPIVDLHLGDIPGLRRVQSLFVIFRESNGCTDTEECLSKAIPVVVNNRIVMPVTFETLDMAWEDYRQALNQIKQCQNVSTSSITIILNTSTFYLIWLYFCIP